MKTEISNFYYLKKKKRLKIIFQSILTVKKDEKASMQKAAFERSQRISQHERELRREEQERMEIMGKKLKVGILSYFR